jgi:hypothetical protein
MQMNLIHRLSIKTTGHVHVIPQNDNVPSTTITACPPTFTD